jgi:allantoinase
MCSHPRNFVGYGAQPPDPRWPNGARIAVNFVINFEEGSEPSMPDGDSATEAGLIECPSDATPGTRDLASESMFEYGSRVGFWRVLREFEGRGLPATVMACALAMQRLPEATGAILSRPDLFDLCCHGYRWENHFDMDPSQERAQIRRALDLMEEITGRKTLGWYCRTAPSVNTRAILLDEGGKDILYDSDAYNDELPYWTTVGERPHLVVPYSLCTNDSKYAPGRAFSTSNDYFVFLRDSFDVLYEEGGRCAEHKYSVVAQTCG